MEISKYSLIILVAFGLTISTTSYADKNSEFKNINNHWQMIMNEKDKIKRGPMIQEHRMMINKFEKNHMMQNQQQNMPANQMGRMQGNNSDGMPGNHMGGMSGQNMSGMSDDHMNMMNTIQMHRSTMNMMGK